MMNTELTSLLEQGMNSVWAMVGMLVQLLIIAFAVVSYVLRSVGMYTIAKRRQTGCAWMAWLPLLNHFLLGGISDQYRQAVKGKKGKLRWWLLALAILWSVCFIVFLVCVVMLALQVVFGVLTLGLIFLDKDYAAAFEQTLNIAMFLPWVVTAAGIPLAVVRYVALHNLYASCNPEHKGMLLVLNIIFGVTEPFFIFFNRKKDRGMPCKTETPISQPLPPEMVGARTEEPAEEPAETASEE